MNKTRIKTAFIFLSFKFDEEFKRNDYLHIYLQKRKKLKTDLYNILHIIIPKYVYIKVWSYKIVTDACNYKVIKKKYNALNNIIYEHLLHIEYLNLQKYIYLYVS